MHPWIKPDHSALASTRPSTHQHQHPRQRRAAAFCPIRTQHSINSHPRVPAAPNHRPAAVFSRRPCAYSSALALWSAPVCASVSRVPSCATLTSSPSTRCLSRSAALLTTSSLVNAVRSRMGSSALTNRNQAGERVAKRSHRELGENAPLARSVIYDLFQEMLIAAALPSLSKLRARAIANEHKRGSTCGRSAPRTPLRSTSQPYGHILRLIACVKTAIIFRAEPVFSQDRRLFTIISSA